MAFLTIELKTNDEGGTAATVLYSDGNTVAQCGYANEAGE